SFLAGHFTISGDFSATPSAQCRVALNPGKSCTYAVTFIPQVPGNRTGTLTVLTDVGNLSVSLSGTGLAPVPSVAPQTLAFGAQVLQTSSAAQTVTLGNSGNVALAIATITAGGDFTQTNNCGTSLAAATTCSINVVFTPTALGTRTSNLAIATNSGSFTVSLSGLGASAVAL